MSIPSIDPQDVNQVIGGLVILFFAYRRFNTPVSSRSSTTAFRFHTAAVIYSILTFAVWLLVTRVGLDQVPKLDPVDSPILGALLITGLLPHTPGLDAMDRWVRGKLHAVAAIPTEIRRLQNILAGSAFEPPPALRDQARVRLLQVGFGEEEIRFEADGSPEHLWTCLTAVMVRLQAWRSESRHGDFLTGLDEWSRLELRYEALVPKARAFFRAMQDLSKDPANDRFEAVRREYRAVFLEQANDLYRRACRVVSRIVLGFHATNRSRQDELAACGFKVDHKVPVTADQLVAVFLLVFALMAPVMTVAKVAKGEDLTEALLISLMVSFIYSSAVVCSVFPRERWADWAKRHSGGARPWRFYLVAGVMAAGVAAVLSFATRWILEAELESAWQEALARSPWLLMAFVTAFMLALLSDNEPSRDTSALRWRLLEAAGMAGVLLATGFMVCYLRWAGELAALGPGKLFAMLEVVLPLTGTIGFFLGAFVPTWYRQPISALEPQPAGVVLAATA